MKDEKLECYKRELEKSNQYIKENQNKFMESERKSQIKDSQLLNVK